MAAASRRWRIGAFLAALAWLAPAVAHADPITATVVAFVNVIGGAAVAAAVGNFLVVYGATIYATAASWALTKLSAPKGANSSQERQAQVAALTVGEVPREMIVGTAGTGGSLVDAYYYGGTNGTDWNTFVIALADHRCEALVGFYVGDTYVPFTGDGPVAGYNGQLVVYWRPGAADDAPFPGDVSGLGPATAAGSLKGVAKVVVSFKADPADSKAPIWTTGRPTFMWVVKGARCYDPRKDDTVPGGSGPHRWNDPATWEWSENAEICRYAFARGVYALDAVDNPAALRMGRGLTPYEAPPERVFAAANLCDELVDLGEGQSEPRYRVGGVIKANETFDRVEQYFADATGGFIIQPEGGVAVDPGQARSPVASITDADLLAGVEAGFSYFRSASDRVNTVVPRYVEPAQKWADTAATVCRDPVDVAADGGPAEETLALPLVTSRSQAERLGEMRRRQQRLERTATIQLGPRFAHLEEGDWIEWTSERFTRGETVVFRITAYALDAGWRNTLALEETSYDVFGFGGLPSVAPEAEPGIPPGALALAGVTAIAVQLEGEDGSLVPAIRFGWTTPVDPAVTTIRAEVRKVGGENLAQTTTTAVNDGQMDVTNGVPASAYLEARLVPLGGPGRAIVPSAWKPVHTGSLVSSDTKKLGDRVAEEWEALLSDAVAQVDQAVTVGREAQLMVLQEAAEAAGRDFDLEKRIAGSSGRPTGATLANQVRQVAEAKQSLVENYSEMITGFDNVAGALALEQLNRSTADQSLQLFQVSLAGVVDSNHSEATFALATLTTAQSSTATALLALSSSTAGNLSSISSSLTTLSTTQGSQATALFALQTTVGGHTASIVTTQATVADLSGHVVASYGVDINADGVAVGFKGITNGLTGGWQFYGPSFGIRTNSGSVKYPFFVSGDTVYTADLVIDGSLVITGSVDAPALAANATSASASDDHSDTVNSTGGDITVLSATVHLKKAGSVRAAATLAQHFPSGNRNWRAELWIDGVLRMPVFGADGLDAVPLSGRLPCAAGDRTVTVVWRAAAGVQLDYRTLEVTASW